MNEAQEILFATIKNICNRAIIIYWNTVHIGHAVAERRSEGLDVPPELLAHISPLGWAHILLTGEYLWPKEATA